MIFVEAKDLLVAFLIHYKQWYNNICMGLSPHSSTDIQTSPFGLALSGGGYRATLFHLGALRRLNEIGWLKRLDRISSVSGGSLLLGYLLCRVPDVLDKTQGIEPADWREKVSEPVHRFVKNDLRTQQGLENFTINLLVRRDKRLSRCIKRLRKIYGPTTLGDIQRKTKRSKWPEIYIIATECVFGSSFKFSNVPRKSGISALGKATLNDVDLATACMASACFPPVFGPYFPNLKPDQFSGKTLSEDVKARIGSLALVDGGLYDNLGTNMIIGGPDSFIRLFSDAGNPLGMSSKETKSSKVVIRYLKLMSSFIGRLNFQRVRTIKKNSYAFWSAQFTQKNAGHEGFGFEEDLVETYLEHVRTDLDQFSDEEAKILENHGYAQTELALQKEFGSKYKRLQKPPAQWPYPEAAYTHPETIKPILVRARKGKYLSQLLRLRIIDPAPR